MSLNPYLKAIYAAVLGGLSAAGTALLDGHISGVEWVAIATAVLLSGGGVLGVSNIPAAQEPQA